MTPDAPQTNRDLALALHKAGKVREAAAMYEELLRLDPADAGLWGLLSVAQLRLGQGPAAVASWRKSLAAEEAIPARLRSIANFLLAMQQKDKADSLQPGYVGPDLDFLRGLTIPDWPPDIPLDSTQRSIVAALARCLAEFGRKDEARRLLVSALAAQPGDPQLLAAAGPVLIQADDPDGILARLEPFTSDLTDASIPLFIIKAAALQALGEQAQAETLRERLCEALPAHATAAQQGQRRLIGVVNPMPGIPRETLTPDGMHFSNNTPATLASRMNNEYRFLSMLPRARSLAASLARFPKPDLLINNWVNAEHLSKAGELDFIAQFTDSFGIPVINHPRRAAIATRQRNAERLAGIPGLVVPRVLRLINTPDRRDMLVKVIQSEVGFPVIIRDTFAQKGFAAAKIATPDDLSTYLAGAADAQLYAIQYVHNPVPQGAYRKIRAAVIGNELFLLHVHFGAVWNVHRSEDRRNLTAFDTQGTATAFARKVLIDPEAALGKAAMTALQEIRRRMPLDIFGIDFDLLPDGRVLFFEANAAMHLSMREGEDLPETIQAMRRAYRRLFDNPPRGAPAA